MTKRLLLIGIDAMSPLVVERLFEKGKLPNFKKLKFHTLQTTTPPETPVAWSAAATGANPGRFGIYDFIDRNPANYLPRLCLTQEKPGLIKTEYRSEMKGTPFWKRLNDGGISTTVIRWPVTFPAEPIKGRMLSGLGVVDIKGSLNSYSFYTEDKSAAEGEGKEKVILVDPSANGAIDTAINGPLVRKRGELVAIKSQCTFKKDAASITLSLEGKDYKIDQGKWSSFIPVKFKVLPLFDLHGIFNCYLVSTNPLRLYISSVQLDPAHPAQPLTYPKEYGAELVEKIGHFYTLGMPEETKAVTEGKLPVEAFFRQIDQIEDQREAHLRYELERFKEGVLAFIFDAGDRLQHMAWEKLDGRDVPKEIEDYYVRKDRLLGEILEKLGSECKIIVMSDHGFSHFDKQVNVNTWLQERGYIKRNADGAPELYRYVDWSATKAYAVGFTSVFLNLKGREGKGIVDAAQGEKILADISAGLLDLKDNGKPVVRSVYRGSEIYTGKFADEAPDLVVGFAAGYRMSWKSAIGMLDSEVISDNTSPWKADHLIDSCYVPGVLFTNFEINKESPSIIDVAPTILNIFGQQIPAEIDGAPLV